MPSREGVDEAGLCVQLALAKCDQDAVDPSAVSWKGAVPCKPCA